MASTSQEGRQPNASSSTLHESEKAGPAKADQPPPPQEQAADDTQQSSDVLIVDWDGPDDPQNPKNWSYARKWQATAIVSSFTFISPVSSTMIAPASEQLAAQFGITSSVVIALTTSVFVLAYAIGPLFLAPLSEIYGRSRVIQLSNLWYLAWNLGCGFAQNEAQLVVFRFLAGLGGSAPLAIGGGLLGDCWNIEERGQAIALYSLAPLLGPVFGPLTGSWIAERSSWRWVFWSTSIVDGAVQILGLFYLTETFAPLLLERKAAKIRKTMDAEKTPYKEVRTIYDGEHRSWQHIMRKSLFRPFQLFFQEPIIQMLGVYMAFVYGLLYLFLTTMPGMFEGVYHESVGISGLHYLALGVGLSGASQLNARMLDRLYIYFKNKGDGIGRPEYRLPGMFIGTACLPIGLFLTGWTVQNKVFWLVPDIGIAFVGAGTILNFQCIQTYVVDAFTLHAASAIAAVVFFRSLAGFGFPLFAPAMYAKLGYGTGDSILAAVSIVIGGPAPIIFWKYGERIRKASRNARK